MQIKCVVVVGSKPVHCRRVRGGRAQDENTLGVFPLANHRAPTQTIWLLVVSKYNEMYGNSRNIAKRFYKHEIL